MWNMDEWTGCYPSKWKGMVVPESISHPAKFSSRLIRRIYEHMIGEGWLHEGDRVVDPFGGVGLGALDAMKHGLIWTGMELEAKFSDLGNQNITHWNARFGQMPHWGSAMLLNGDSRKLLEIIKSGRAAYSSPPYEKSMELKGGIDPDKSKHKGGPHSQMHNSDTRYGSTDGQLGAMKADGFDAAVSSPPFEQHSADGGWQMLGKYAEEGKLTVKQVKGNGSKSYPSWDKARDTSYGESDGQLSNMDSGGFDAAISSPPFLQAQDGGGIARSVRGDSDYPLSPGSERTKKASRSAHGFGYQNQDESYGNLANMADGDFQAAISSPPFRQSEGGTGAQGGTIDNALMRRHAAGNSAAEGYGGTEGQLANMDEGSFESAVSSPPYNLPMSQTHNGKRGGTRGTTPSEDGAFVKYGNSDGQLEGMDMDGFEATVSSPPFADNLSRDYLGAEDRRQLAREQGISNAEHVSPIDMEKIGKRNQEYGKADGQLGTMSAENFDAAISSPPYEGEVVRARSSHLEIARMEAKGYKPKGTAGMTAGVLAQEKYGDTEGNIGNDSGDDFWLAARQIVEQVYLALEPGGHAVWVCKDFVKSKSIVPFSDQWRQLCEAVGFVTLHEHHAMLVHASQYTLEGGVKHNESKSFFRRLAEKKGSPRIDFETVWCMVRP